MSEEIKETLKETMIKSGELVLFSYLNSSIGNFIKKIIAVNMKKREFLDLTISLIKECLFNFTDVWSQYQFEYEILCNYVGWKKINVIITFKDFIICSHNIGNKKYSNQFDLCNTRKADLVEALEKTLYKIL